MIEYHFRDVRRDPETEIHHNPLTNIHTHTEWEPLGDPEPTFISSTTNFNFSKFGWLEIPGRQAPL